ncbi:protein of unknown function DUF583 [Paenibacillus curdlanolyticus YK9]|uniref:Integral membrane protein CcmA involved in cell shape determination n=1 Tax=Paenibacillus curdlanolyticus YK9 TaxID=717606 RepID=E0I784_9BACL|nr:polymer-forming cytoskeletal protein [Paenibacillus curdlanolyticus]EFM11900.1 protein of unknown function DUF583 [Paenibacillus curdlanolyticus YK9]
MFKETKRLNLTDTLIGQGTHVEGKMICEAGLRIEGEYRGDIECSGDVIIGECGIARSNIIARDVTIAGKVFGDVSTKGRLTITATGQLHGNIYAQSFVMQDGGIFTGACKMDRSQEQPHSRSLLDAEPHQPQQSAKEKRQAQAG